MPVGVGIALIIMMIWAGVATYFAGRYYADLGYFRLKVAKVLEPFASFGKDNVDSEGWNDIGVSTKNERVVDWFGPSDFRRANELYQQTRKDYGPEIDTDMA